MRFLKLLFRLLFLRWGLKPLKASTPDAGPYRTASVPEPTTAQPERRAFLTFSCPLGCHVCERCGGCHTCGDPNP